MRAGAWLPTALGLALWPITASGTWSIAAVDPRTREVGVAVASCLEAPHGSTVLPFVAGLAPGRGALVAQALYDEPLRDRALALLLRGAGPQQVIDALVASDPRSATRQYGVVVLAPSVAAFTGTDTEAWAGQRQGHGVTVQGNILRGPAVIDDALAAFEAAAPGCPWTLADRLMLALEAGASAGGDGRCTPEQAALAAALRVAAPGDDPEAPTLDLRIPSQLDGGSAPVALLRVAYDEWRRDHPPDASGCPLPAADRPSIPPATADPADARPASDGSCRCGSTTATSPVPLALLLVVGRRRAARRSAAPPAPGAISPHPKGSPTRGRPWGREAPLGA